MQQNAKTVIAVLIVMTLVFFWGPIFTWVGTRLGYDMTPRQPPADVTSVTTSPSSQPGDVASATQQAPGVGASTNAAVTGLRVAPATQPRTATDLVKLGSDTWDQVHKMGLTISPQGAGLEGVVLNEFKRDAKAKDPYSFQHPYAGYEAVSRPFATRQLVINGAAIELGNQSWELESAGPESATYVLTAIDGDRPVARVRKTFQLLPVDDPSLGYEVVVTHSFENLTAAPLNIRTTYNGPTMPPFESYRGGDRQTIAGYLVRDQHIEVNHDTVESFTKDKAERDYAKDKEGHPAMWMGTASIYFQALTRPMPLDDSKGPPKHVEKAIAKALDPEAKSGDHLVMTTFSTGDLTVAAGQTLAVPTRAYFGPRKRQVLNSPYYTSFPLSYDKTLVLTSGPCGVCTFQWIINGLVWLLGVFHFLFRDWGLAIIALVCIVRILLHPITKRSQIAMSKMSKMAPEMERLKKKHGDDKEALSKAMWELQKEQGVGAYLGCLPMFLQMPIWIALYSALQTTFELRHAPFLWGFTWIHDLAQPDHLVKFAQPLQISFLPTISGINILPILLGVVFYFQMKYQQPKNPAMTKEQQQQQKMMQWMMPFLFPVMLYSGPAGLNLYIFASTFIGIIESKVVRKHIQEREEAEKAGRVIVDPGKKFKGGGGAGGATQRGAQKPSGGIMGWLASLQEKAEQMRREGDRRGK